MKLGYFPKTSLLATYCPECAGGRLTDQVCGNMIGINTPSPIHVYTSGIHTLFAGGGGGGGGGGGWSLCCQL